MANTTDSVDKKNNSILKYYNDKFLDNNKKANQPRVEVEAIIKPKKPKK